MLVNTREADGIKYVVVVNNNRQAGPYSEWTRIRTGGRTASRRQPA